MKTMQLIKKDSYDSRYGLASYARFTPYCFSDGKNEYFISNLITSTGDNYQPDSRQRNEMAEKLKALRLNNFKFICFYCGKYDDPFKFLEWVKEVNYSLLRHGKFFVESKSGNFIDLGGNLKECSCAFNFRIYDKEMVKKLRHLVSRMKKSIHR